LRPFSEYRFGLWNLALEPLSGRVASERGDVVKSTVLDKAPCSRDGCDGTRLAPK